ncbi:hypothetical protein T12_10801 [Trichinella patagoniensis]|uniref:Uncharacterized protein n=1 Tax=Trichinella patagoniensis TaxID=990121 RepID=A0A0V1A647_9BILA|nr:hypothetical protein T12_10801 [Trichinella patagoniensis]
MFNLSTCIFGHSREATFACSTHHGLLCLDDVIFAALLAGQTCARILLCAMQCRRRKQWQMKKVVCSYK